MSSSTAMLRVLGLVVSLTVVVCAAPRSAGAQPAISSGSSPASIRQSIWATASGGMTLLFSLPRSIVTAKVVRTIAANCRFAKNRARNAVS